MSSVQQTSEGRQELVPRPGMGAKELLREVGANEDRIRLEHRRLRTRLAFESTPPEGS